jgi:hypothetical protein
MKQQYLMTLLLLAAASLAYHCNPTHHSILKVQTPSSAPSTGVLWQLLLLQQAASTVGASTGF